MTARCDYPDSLSVLQQYTDWIFYGIEPNENELSQYSYVMTEYMEYPFGYMFYNEGEQQ